MTSKIIETADKVIAATYKRFPLVLTKGKGCTVWDEQGKAYTDFVSGIAVCNLGHAHPRIAKALSQQAEILFHVSNLYYTIPQTELAQWLFDHSFADRAFFCNSGAEANEAAIKIVRRYFSEKGQPNRFKIITMQKSFHGRTMATLSATGQDKIKKGFDPILQGFDYVPFNDIEALKSKIDDSTAAIMLEPIQGEGGVICPNPGYLEAVRKLCNDKNILLVFDEVQTGIGRTGKLFAYQHFGVEPDVMTLAKALGNGLPIGAMLAKQEVAKAFSPGAHASTFGGTPIVTAAALETLKTLTEEKIIEHCQEIGAYFREKLLQLKSGHEIIEDVRGMGLLLGMKLKIKGESIVNACMAKGFLINCVQEDILRFIPPLIIQKAEIDALIICLDEVLK